MERNTVERAIKTEIDTKKIKKKKKGGGNAGFANVKNINRNKPTT